MTEALKKKNQISLVWVTMRSSLKAPVPVSMPIDELNKMMRTYLEESLNEF